MRKTALNKVFELAQNNKNVLFVGSDLGAGVLNDMKKSIPERFLMEGVCEQNIIGMSSGLAMEGFLPYVNTIGTFLTRRCYEQIVLDVCLHNLPVRFIGNGGGLVYAPLGLTHLSTDDFAILRVIPNMSIIAPCDAYEMGHLMDQSLNWQGPLYIRLARGGDQLITDKFKKLEIGKALIIKEPEDGLFITTGVMTQIANAAIELLTKDGYKVGLLHCSTVKPLDTKTVIDCVKNSKVTISVEEHSILGGFGSLILETVNEKLPNNKGKLIRIGLPDNFSKNYGDQESHLNHYGITKEKLYLKMKESLNVYK